MLFEEQSMEALIEAVHDFEDSEGAFRPNILRTHAAQFSLRNFTTGMQAIIDEELLARKPALSRNNRSAAAIQRLFEGQFPAPAVETPQRVAHHRTGDGPRSDILIGQLVFLGSLAAAAPRSTRAAASSSQAQSASAEDSFDAVTAMRTSSQIMERAIVTNCMAWSRMAGVGLPAPASVARWCATVCSYSAQSLRRRERKASLLP